MLEPLTLREAALMALIACLALAVWRFRRRYQACLVEPDTRSVIERMRADGYHFLLLCTKDGTATATFYTDSYDTGAKAITADSIQEAVRRAAARTPAQEKEQAE